VTRFSWAEAGHASEDPCEQGFVYAADLPFPVDFPHGELIG
jgi:hypothetical protein